MELSYGINVRQFIHEAVVFFKKEVEDSILATQIMDFFDKYIY